MNLRAPGVPRVRTVGQVPGRGLSCARLSHRVDSTDAQQAPGQRSSSSGVRTEGWIRTGGLDISTYRHIDSPPCRPARDLRGHSSRRERSPAQNGGGSSPGAASIADAGSMRVSTHSSFQSHARWSGTAGDPAGRGHLQHPVGAHPVAPAGSVGLDPVVPTAQAAHVGAGGRTAVVGMTWSRSVRPARRRQPGWRQVRSRARANRRCAGVGW